MPNRCRITCCALAATLVCLTIAPHGAQAESPYPVAWKRSVLAPLVDDLPRSTYTFSSSVDSAGNALIGGYTYTNPPWSNYADNGFVAKYDTAGNALWFQPIDTPASDRCFGLATDAAGTCCLVAGFTTGNLGGPHAGNEDAFLAKCDSAGNLLWSRQLGTPTSEWGWVTAVDRRGNAYLAGTTYGSLLSPNAGDLDTFLVKYSPTGDQLWARQVGSSAKDQCIAVTTDTADSVYVTGWVYGRVPGPTGGREGFLAKYDADGNPLWTHQLPDPAGTALAVDAVGNIYVAGDTNTSSCYVSKYDSAGNPLWRQTFWLGGAAGDASVAVDTSGNVFLSGTATDILTTGVTAGFADAFLAKYDPDGHLLWSDTIATEDNDYARGVSVDAAGNVYVGGFMDGHQGGPDWGVATAFLIKYAVPEPATAALLLAPLTALVGSRRRRRQ